MNSVVIQTLFSFSSFLILTIDLPCQTRSFEDSDSPGYPKENNTVYSTFSSPIYKIYVYLLIVI